MQCLFLKNFFLYLLAVLDIVAVSGLSLAVSRGGYSLVAAHRFLAAAASLAACYWF